MKKTVFTLRPEFHNLIKKTLPEILKIFPTPFFLYTENGIRRDCQALFGAFSGIPGYRNFYAVKANNNPTVLETVRSEGCGFDCSSVSEVLLAEMTGAAGEDIFFSSNNTSEREFKVAFAGGYVFNFDDLSLLSDMPGTPEIACCRFNPGPLARTDGNFVGKPEDAKYGLMSSQALNFFRVMIDQGVKRFMLHTMICSNERDYTKLVLTAKMMLDVTTLLSEKLDIRFEAINIGGGFGIPYNPETDQALDLEALGSEVTDLFLKFEKKHGWMPKLFTENGRYLAGHNGVLVTRAINFKNTYRDYVGVDAQTFSSVPRPFIYGAHHEITVLGKENWSKDRTYDVVGSLCENADKFAEQRKLPEILRGDILLIHNAGAHCYAMSGNYNGRTRPAEIMIFSDGSFGLIRRAQTEEDLFREMVFPEKIQRLSPQ